MQGSFVIDYKRVGNTYDLPNNVWALSRVDLYDGLRGDGPEHTSSVYDYAAGKYDRNEREFYGFGKVITKNLDTDHGDAVYRTTEDDYFTDNYYDKGLLKSTVLKDANGNKFTEVANTIQLKSISSGATLPDVFAQTDDGAAFPALIKTYKLFYEGQGAAGKTDSTTYSYDQFGNLSRSTDFGDPGTDDDVSTIISYHSVPGKYIMNVPSSVTVSGSATTYRQRASDIDNNTGNITETRLYLASGDVAKYDMTYDTYGNLASMTRPQNAAGQRLKYNYEYDGDVQTYITKISDSYGYSSTATYDIRFGQQLTNTDLNGQQTQYTLDAAGRLLTIRRPLEIASGQPFTIAFEYHPDDPVAWAMARHYDPAHPGNYLETAAFRDGIGREVQTKKDIALFSGAKAADQEVMVVSGSTVFDAFFRPVKQWYPLTEPKGTIGTYNTGSDTVTPEGMSYDVMDRILTDTLPDLAMRKMAYGFGNDHNGVVQFKTTSTDANGISTESFLNVRELLKATKQQYSQGSDVWTSYDYNPVNELINVTDDQKNVITMGYDQFGRKTSDVHPDAGATNYKYDLAGNLVEKTTANLQSGSGIKYTYDRERLVKTTYPINPQNNVTLTYGAPGETFFRAGRVSTQQDGSGTQQFFYNPLGAVVKDIRVINVPDTVPLTYTTEWTYDTWNRLTAMVYPDGEKLTYNYNVGGSLLNMTGVNNGTTYNYVAQLGYDKFETRVFMQYGNGTAMTYTFGAQRRELAKMTAKTSASRFMMDNTYTWDNENEILNIVNAAPVPPSNMMGGPSSYKFSYDDLYRLTNSSGLFSTSTHQDRFTQAMMYNTVFSVLSKTQLHERKGNDDTTWTRQNQTSYNYAYNYSNTGTQPHAGVHIGNDAYTYDANGNQTGWQDDVSAQNREITWDEENRIQGLSDNGQQFNYTYDGDDVRVLKNIGNAQTVSINGKKAAQTSGTGNYVIYVNPYEVVRSGNYTKHYYIEGQRIASILGVTGNGGKVATFQFYYHPDHLGNSAFITDASGEVYQHLEYFPFGETFVEEHSNQQRTPYLYNGKELDDETGLYYYGGRYYDPITSIWENVDPSWDRPAEIGTSPYAYVQDNPITYVDPDGRYKSFSDLTAKQQIKLINTLVEIKKNQMARRAASAQNNNPNAIQPSAAVADGSSTGSSGTHADANGGKSAGKQIHLTLSVLGVNVLTTDPHKKTWLESQKEKQENIKKNWETARKNYEKAKKTSISTFVKMSRTRQMWQKRGLR
jgi:RHS repeat-associated protein